MFYNPFTRKGFAKGLAQAQLKALRAMQRRFPQLSKLELYTLALSTRPGYTEQQIVALITDAIEKIVTYRWAQGYTEETRESVTKRGLDFRFVVLALANDEFKQTLGREPSNAELEVLAAGVEAVIPSSVCSRSKGVRNRFPPSVGTGPNTCSEGGCQGIFTVSGCLCQILDQR